MALIVRIDVDRPYGRTPVLRHALSRLSSDLYFPKVKFLGYLRELGNILQILSEQRARAYIFFRRCTLPSSEILRLIDDGGHEIGLHLEDSRSFETFLAEKQMLELHVRRPVLTFSKHGSGGEKYGLRHHAPYEPSKYIEWAQRLSMKAFFGNLEDPRIAPHSSADGVLVHPSAFWLEPAWRDTAAFTVEWLITEAASSNIVLLIHPENILSSSTLVKDLRRLITSLETRILE
jgi:hypothetical protein